MDYVVDTSSWPTKSSVDSTPPFRYSELESGGTQIRLVKILRNTNRFDSNPPLELELSQANLYDKPFYGALSYTWGSPGAGFPAEWDDPSYTVPVYINKCVLYVRANLHGALLELRRKLKETTCIWIDAICINQSNIGERNAQVQNMASIYSQSAIILAWLGPEDGKSLMAFRSMNVIAESWNRLPKSLRQSPIRDEHVDEYREFLESRFGREDSLDLWQSVAVFLQRRWFSRAWVLQEVCCAPGVIIFSNAQWMSFSKLRDVCNLLAHLGLNLERARPKDWKSKSHCLTTLSHEIAPLLELAASETVYRSHRRNGGLPELSIMLNRLRCTNASDSRDKVYAARSLSSMGLEVDYNKTTEEVFIETALAILRTPYGFNILGDCYHHVGDHLSLPSWVPDWTKDRNEYYSPLPKKGRFVRGFGEDVPFYSTGGQDVRSEAQYDPAKRLLMIEAFLLDNFEPVGTDSRDPPQRGVKLSGLIT